MLTDMQLRALKPAQKIYKVADQRGLYAAVTENRVIDSTVKLIRDDGTDFDPFTVHDPRRMASTLSHEAGFNTDWKLYTQKLRMFISVRD